MYNNNMDYKKLIAALLFLIGYPIIIGYIKMKVVLIGDDDFLVKEDFDKL